MRERIRPTRSGLFAIELVVAVGVFTLCAAICTGIFAQSEVMSRDSAALTRAVNEARNTAERFKAVNGDLARLSGQFGGRLSGDTLSQSYDADWSPTTDTGAEYEIRLTRGPETPGCIVARLEAIRDGGLAPAFEVMRLNNAIRNLVRDSRVHQIDSVIQTSAAEGMIAMDESILRLRRAGRVSTETALYFAVNPEQLQRKLPRS